MKINHFMSGRLCICQRRKKPESAACDTCLTRADSLNQKGWKETTSID